ncbi:hypothetical protein BDW22DRAFT_1433464 [Trametopsis cervina]|nr:hypothetical protein BDW22DRAFT_1433464 [Trametopsis cervina]
MITPQTLPSVLLSRSHAAGSDDNHVEAKIFVTFQLLGGLGNLAMLVTALASKRVNRHVTWLNFCITWIIYVISYTLLLYSGHQFSEEPPAFALCLTQAALVYGAPVLVASSTVSLVVQIWFSLRMVVTWQQPEHRARAPSYWTVLLVAMPYIVWFPVTMAALSLGLADHDSVVRSDSADYCSIATGVPGHITAGLVAFFVVIAIVFEALIANFLRRYWGAYNKLRPVGQIGLSMVIRTACFLALNIIAVSQIVVFLAKQFTIANIWISITPIAAVAVFGTQRDIMRVWTFRKPANS